MKKNLLIIIVILIIGIICIWNLLNKENNQENNITQNEVLEQNEYTEVKSATSFFTVQECVNKYLNYIVEEDEKSIYRILDEQYINDFNVTESNVLNKVEDINESVNFSAEKMYVSGLGEDYQTYYVSGTLSNDGEDLIDTEVEKLNITINLDLDNMIFSVIPYGYGGIFYEESN